MKSRFSSIIIIAIILAVVTIILFALPGEISNLCVGIYITTIVIYLFAMYCSYDILNQHQKLIFLGTPLLFVVYVMAFLQTLLLFTAKFLLSMPSWIAVVVEALIIGGSAVIIVSLTSSIPYIKEIDDSNHNKQSAFRQLASTLIVLSQKETNPELKTLLKQLATKVKYSDPVSNERLANIEEIIKEKVDSLSTLDTAERRDLIMDIEVLLIERNEMCKLQKL